MSRRAMLSALLLLLSLNLSAVQGFVNSPKIITKDGNLIFESGSNRNISFRLTGKSRMTINDEYDVLELLLAANSSSAGGAKKRQNGPNYAEDPDLRDLVDDLSALKTRAFGSNGLSTLMRQLQNRTRAARVLLRRYQTRLRNVETKVQRLSQQLELNSCQSNPCENGGSCYNTFNGFRCQCRSAFEGAKCERDVNECALYEGTDLGCQNGAQCVNQFGAYSCICSAGWYGMHCSQRKGDCAQSSAWELCGHGSCVASNDAFGYKCLCEPGWRTNGLTPACNVDVDECSTQTPCAHQCINLPGTFTCAPCPPGLTGNGISCRDINECETNNGGCSLTPRVDCYNSYGSHHCGECPVGWTGDGRSCLRSSSNSQTDAADLNSCATSNICHPSASCSEISGTVVCSCPAGFLGSGIGSHGCVRASANNCNELPCLNGGTCVDLGTSNFTCVCPAGYRAPHCLPAPSPCQPNPCRNGGRCVAVGSGFVCQCEPGYRDRVCGTRFSSCNALLTGLTGRLRYPPDGTGYEHNAQCAWVIRTNETLVLNVTFSNFDLEDSTDCRFDWLQLNDGRTAAAQLIGRYCGRHRPRGGNIISSTNHLYLWFRSDNSTAREGFELQWQSIAPQCGGLIEVETHGTIASPGSPGNYPKNRDCRWQLRAPSSRRIKLTFFSLQLEQHTDCNFDYVAISDAISGRELFKYCSTDQPPPLLLPTNEAIVHFHSDETGSDTGFQLHYSTEERQPGCGGVYTAQQGTIKSPIQSSSSDPISCEYEIRMGRGESISIDFVKFAMRGDECLELYDVTDEGEEMLQSKQCGNYGDAADESDSLPAPLNSLYSRLRLRFYASSGGSFELRYRMDCSYTYESSNGTLTTPGYPNLTNSERFCSYKIVTEPNTVIAVNRVDFQLLDNALLDGKDADCATTYLRINDGLDRNIMGPFCGDSQPTADFVSKTNMLIFHLKTGSTTAGRGFKFNYKAVPIGQTDCGGVYTKSGQTIKLPLDDDGSYLNDMSCYWVIMAPPGKGILLNWLSFRLEASSDCSYDYVEIYDNLANRDSDKALARYCDLMPPSDFISHSRLLTIMFKSDADDTSDGFELRYEFVNMSSCGGHIHSSTGRLTSPEFPLNYTNGVDCEWIISGPIGSQIELQTELFELEATPNCSGDSLTVRNGGSNDSIVIGRYCGTRIPRRLPSFTNELHLRFHSDAFVNARGFRLSWRIYANSCGGRIIANAGGITSPQYPNAYPHNAQCEWQVTVHQGSAIRFVVEDLEMESLFDCMYDHVDIYEGHNIAAESPLRKLCQRDDDEPLIVETTGSEATVVFRSDTSNSQRGFRMTYDTNCWRTITAAQGVIESLNFDESYYERPLNCSWTIKAPHGNHILLEFSHYERRRGETAASGGLYFREAGAALQSITEQGGYNVTSDTLTIVHNSTAVSFRLEYRIDGCMQLLRGASGSFHLPNYPAMYANNLECYWIIQVEPGSAIELTVNDLDLEESVNCTKDALVIGNHATEYSTRERHCGHVPKLLVTSASHRLHVRFISDAAHNGRGFNASYRTIKTTCGGKLVAKNGIIMSPSYPQPYPINMNCEWIVEVSEHHTITFEVEDMELENGLNCVWDYLEAFDLPGNSLDDNEENQIFKVCDGGGGRKYSSSNRAVLRFVSDDSVQHRGFKLQFYESCGARLVIDETDLGYIDIARHVARNETCVWQLVAADPAKHIIFTPTHVLLNRELAAANANEGDCMERGVKIYDGTEAVGEPRLKFCNSHPPAVISNGLALTISVPFDLVAEFEGHYMTMDTVCGSQYDSLSGKFTSPYYPNSYPVNIQCEWVVEASAGNSIALTFQSLDMEQSDDCNNDYVEVREESDRGPLLGVYCGHNVPPAMKSKSTIWIKFKSNDDVVGEGFMVSYNYERHNELSGNNGTIESPRYPSKFISSEPYSWRITVDTDHVVLLTIKHIVDVDQPFVHFYDGYSDIGAQIDFSRSHVVRSNTNILYLTATRGPFRFEWERLSKDAVRSNRTAEELTRLCGHQTITVNNTITFNSPGYPLGYADNMRCSWTFLPGNLATHAVLQLGRIDLEDYQNCFADYLTVSASSDLQSWQELSKLCSQPNDTSLRSFQGKPYLKLDFVTDAGINKTGFSTIVRTACGSELSASRGFVNITKLVTPATLFQQECVWTIRVRPGRRVRLTFVDSQIHDSSLLSTDPDQCRNFFVVRNGFAEDSPFLGRGKYCDNNITDVLESSSNRAYVKFKRLGYTRFRAAFRYEEISHACSEDIVLTDEAGLDGRSRVISSSNYPNLPNPHSECVWRVTAPLHHSIAVEFFGNFDLATGSGPLPDACDREYLQLNDGSTELMPLIGRYCGKRKPDTIYSSGNVLRLKYFNDVSEPRQGFQARLKLGRCGGSYYSNEGLISSPEKLQLDIDERSFECVYTIEVEKGNTIQLNFERVRLPIYENCSTHTHLQLDEIEAFGYEGEEKVSDKLLLCGTESKQYIVETNKVIIRLRLLEGALSAEQGFRLRYNAIGTRCSETIVAVRGVLQSPGYPEGVRTPTHCVWRLQVPKGRRIKVEVLDFDPGVLNPSSPGPVRPFRGRLSFANDFKMQSIIARYSDSNSAPVYSTDNTMAIDAFLLPFNRHRGFKLRFSADGVSDCRARLNFEQGDTMQHYRVNKSLVHCNYQLTVPANQTLLLEVTRHVSHNSMLANSYVCAVISPLKLMLNEQQLLPRLLCNNGTSDPWQPAYPTVRLPFSAQLEISGNQRNDMQELSLYYKSFKCGGIWRLDLGDNMTIQQPQMGADYGSGRLECAWAIWPPDFSEESLYDLSYYVDNVQIEVTLSVDFRGDCKQQYLLLYNGPDQNSPHLGRFCTQSTLVNLVVERGLFFEYHADHYENNSTFNLTVKHGSGCGGKISYPYRDIIFDEQYKNNVECVWEIETEPGFHVGLSFLNRFYIESSAGCTKDYLKVQQRNASGADGEWSDLQTICGRSPPAWVNTTTSAMRLIFRSDGDTVGDGFIAKFERNCGGLLYATAEPQELTSPGYPVQYEKSLQCNYTILPLEPHAPGVLVRFLDFDLEHAPMSVCLFDNVTIRTKDAIGYVAESVLCGVKQKHEYRGKQSVSVVLRTDQSFSGKGFKLDYSTQLCGGQVTETSLVASPRQHTDNKFPPSSDCYWNLTAPAGHKFTIKFESLDYESQSQCLFDGVEVFSGTVPLESQRLGRFCGNLTGKLPTLSINAHQALIRSYSDERDESRGFRALVRLLPNCDEHLFLDEHNASYTFNKYAGNYANDLDCSYVFKAPPGRQLQLEFRSFHVAEAIGCRDDYLEIRDGAGPFADKMGQFCGHELPPKLISSRNALFMRFVSDHTTADVGFEAVVTATPMVCGAPLLKLQSRTPVELKMSAVEQAQIGNNLLCSWKIVGEKTVHLKFNSFELAAPNANGSCDTDYLKIYNSEDANIVERGYGSDVVFNGHMAGQTYASYATEHIYCGSGLPDDYYANAKEVIVKFRTNGASALAKRGFALTAMQAEGCYRNFTGLQGRIKIADTEDHCDVYIRVPANYTLSIYYQDLTLATFDCSLEYVEVFDAHSNSSLQKLCAYMEPGKSLFSTTNELRLRIKMGGFYSAFDMTYLASPASSGPGCGGDLYNTEGLFANAFYPQHVRNNSDCRWRVRVPSNTHVLLTFEFFNMGSKSTCHTDYLQILERNENGEEQQMRRFCGEDAPRVYKSKRSELVVRFHKTVNYDGIGWVIKFAGVYANYEIPSNMLNSGAPFY